MNLDVEEYEERLKTLKLHSMRSKLPKYLQGLIYDNNLISLDNHDDRARIFLQLLFVQRLSGKMIKRHFKTCQPWLFPNTTLIPNTMVFDQQVTPQMRGVDFPHIHRMIEYMREQNIWVLLVGYYTALRLAEVLQLRASHILQLKAQEEIIPIRRKNNTDWRVVYFDEFNVFIDQLRETYSRECQFYLDTKVDTILFRYTPQTLHNKIREVYIKANHTVPPKGFGYHIFRYYVGSQLVADNRIEAAQYFLGHKSIKTTERYIRYTNHKKQLELEQVNSTNSFYKKTNETLKLLQAAPSTTIGGGIDLVL
ncbi:integrase [Crangon crangon nudivirus]|uniref:Integrase n=1 Tax=Crangon crangon nudivirus TaxID=2880838 RepID=A0AAE8Y0Q4_9VIRU|nr:integrase [Crangon crangon nudivirus]UBZ25541.1 integrase [Crangon crangon nudivirus]